MNDGLKIQSGVYLDYLIIQMYILSICAAAGTLEESALNSRVQLVG